MEDEYFAMVIKYPNGLWGEVFKFDPSIFAYKEAVFRSAALPKAEANEMLKVAQNLYRNELTV